MTDKEKYLALVSYLNGVANGDEYYVTLDIRKMKEFISNLDK